MDNLTDGDVTLLATTPEGESYLSTSLHERIRRDIETKIFSGQWQPGQRIPAEDALASAHQCSRMTINKVLTALAKAELIVRKPKVGTFVALRRSNTAVIEVLDVSVEVTNLGLPYSFTLLRRAKRKALKSDCAKLSLPPASNILELRCCHFAGNHPFCLEDRIISLVSVPDAEHESFVAMAPTTWLISKIPWSEAEQSIHAVLADEETSRILDVPRGSAGLTIERNTWLADRFVTWARFSYPGDAYHISAKFVSATGI